MSDVVGADNGRELGLGEGPSKIGVPLRGEWDAITVADIPSKYLGVITCEPPLPNLR